jgi:molybdopterin molybdotransferase
MISIHDALKVIEEESKILGSEKLDIVSCINRVLAEDIYSKDNLPPFDKSAMDGYAIRSEDTENFSIENISSFKIKGLIKAGEYFQGILEKGEAYKIMTGAPLPKGADSVIQIEKVTVKNEKVFVSQRVKKQDNVIKFGEEIRKGELVLKKGTLIRPVEIGVLASLGYSYVKVYKDPTVSLVITGDELIDIDNDLEKGKIRNSNEYSLKALIKNLGLEVLSMGIIPDNKDILKEKIEYALQNSDIVISSGGASVGDYDFVESVLKELGAEIKFTSVAIKPGKPITLATYNDKLFFSLPGNPSSLITTFEEFVKPSILTMMGNKKESNDEFPVILANDFKGKKGRAKYAYVEIKKDKGAYYAYEIGSQCSNHLLTMSKANGLIIIPEECGNVKAGEILNGKYIFKNMVSRYL